LSGNGQINIGTKDLTINQSISDTYSGSISGSGSFTKSGSGNLTFTGNLTNFTGIAKAEAGAFWLNTTLGGSVDIIGGYLVGEGTIIGSVNLLSGTIGPGSGLGTMTFQQNFTQSPGTTFVVHVNNSGQNSFLDVQGIASIGSNTLLRVIDYGSYPKFYTDYLILEADQGVTGAFSSVTVEPILYEPRVTYLTNQVILRFIPSILRASKNSNQRNVAHQLDTITNPNSEQQLLLDTFYSLSNAQVEDGLEELSGEPYANLMLGVEETTGRFYETIFNPLRPYITQKCGIKSCSNNLWIEAASNVGYYKADGHAYKFKSRGYNLALGFQETLLNRCLVGASLFYEADYYTYHREGSSRQYTFISSLYALYRPKSYYILANGMSGASFGKMSRLSLVGNLAYHNQSKPNVYEAAFFIEAGKDISTAYWLFQPFIGLNTQYFNWKQFSESGDSVVALDGQERNYMTLYGRLGVHITSTLIYDRLTLGLDAAINSRFTPLNDHRYVRFRQFGNPYSVEGINIAANSFEANVYLSQKISKFCTLYSDVSCKLWKSASNASFVIGLNYQW
jgi:outer membrane autotransporter protein